MSDMYKQATIMRCITDFFDSKELRYETIEDRAIRLGMNLKCKLKSTNIFISIRNWNYSVNAYLSLSADEAVRAQVAEYLTLVNWAPIYGKFCMDMEDGEIRYTFTIDCEDRMPLSESVLHRSIFIPLDMLEKYGDECVAVMYGIKTPRQAYEDARAALDQ